MLLSYHGNLLSLYSSNSKSVMWLSPVMQLQIHTASGTFHSVAVLFSVLFSSVSAS